jgi:hypothetical protein
MSAANRTRDRPTKFNLRGDLTRANKVHLVKKDTTSQFMRPAQAEIRDPRLAHRPYFTSRFSEESNTPHAMSRSGYPDEEEDIVSEEMPVSQPPEDAPETYVRNRFRYQEKTFGHRFFEKIAVNNRQFGHKKYCLYTEFTPKPPLIRDMIRAKPKWNVALDEIGGYTRTKPTRHILTTYTWIIVVLVLAGLHLSRFRSPDSNLRPIQEAHNIIKDSVVSLSQLFGSHYTASLLVSQLTRVGHLLTESAHVNVTVSEIYKHKIPKKLWSLLDQQATECVWPSTAIEIRVVLQFFHELAFVSPSSQINQKTIAKLVDNCHAQDDVQSIVFKYLIISIGNATGEVALRGIAKPLVSILARQGIGPWQVPALKFFALWSQLSVLDEKDRSEILRLVTVLWKDRESWSREYNAMFCLIDRNLKSGFPEAEAEKVRGKDECKEIFEQFPAPPEHARL